MLQFQIDQDKCIQCGECADDCIKQIIELAPEYPRIVPGGEEQCIKCQHCLTVCPTGAVSIFGIDPEDCLSIDNFPSPEQMDTLVRGRRSIRRYRQENVDQDTVKWLMEMAANAPTGVNDRSVLFTLVDDMTVMDSFRKRTYEALIRAESQGRLPERFAPYIPAWKQGMDVIYRGAPHMVVVSAPDTSHCPEADPFIALSYLELCAAAKGVGTTWCGLAKWCLFDVAPELGRELGIPDNHSSTYVMLFGNPDVTYHRAVKRDNLMLNRIDS